MLPKAQWVHPRFLLTFDNDVRPHVILKKTLLAQAYEFAKREPKVLASLQGVIHSDGKVCTASCSHALTMGTGCDVW